MHTQNLQTYRNLDVELTGQVVTTGVGKLAGWFITNQADATRYLKIYDKTTAPTASDTPIATFALPAGAVTQALGPQGINFSAGLGIRASGAIADNDTTAPSANDVVVSLFYQRSGY